MPTSATVNNGNIDLSSMYKKASVKTAEDQSKMDKDAFLKLLAAQARTQDPMNPTDSTAQIAQLAQFSSLEQMNNMAKAMTSMTKSIQSEQATNLLGRTVTYVSADGTPKTGPVESVKMTTDGALLTVGGVADVSPATITEVR